MQNMCKQTYTSSGLRPDAFFSAAQCACLIAPYENHCLT